MFLVQSAIISVNVCSSNYNVYTFLFKDVHSKELFLEMFVSSWPLCHLGKGVDLGVNEFKRCRSSRGFSPRQRWVSILQSCEITEPRDLWQLILNMASAYPYCLWIVQLDEQQRIVFACTNKGTGRAREFAKLFSTFQTNWHHGISMGASSATPRLNIRCLKDPSKNGNYNVFVMEVRMPNGLEHFLSCSVAVITRPCVTQLVCLSFLEKKLNIWIPNTFNWATNTSKFTGIIKLGYLTRGGEKQVLTQLAVSLNRCQSVLRWILILITS